MKRRSMVLSGLAAAASPLKAAGLCGIATPMGPQCRVYVDRPQIIRQACQEWCWAAAAAMIFAMHGHPVDQRRIVARVYGQLVCLPSMNTLTIAQVLSSRWTDENGDDFYARIDAAYDVQNGINLIDLAYIINELDNNRPLLFANMHHAMVLSQVDFIRTSRGPIIQNAGAFDPWPASPEFHPLSYAEIQPAHLGGQMSFIAAVHIEDV